MELKLNVLARLMLLNNLPEQGSFDKIINKRNVRNKISFTSDEADKMQLETTDNGIKWSPIEDLVVEMTDTEMKFLNDVMNDISEKNLMNEGFIDTAIIIKEYVESIPSKENND